MSLPKKKSRWHERVSNPGPSDPESYAPSFRYAGSLGMGRAHTFCIFACTFVLCEIVRGKFKLRLLFAELGRKALDPVPVCYQKSPRWRKLDLELDRNAVSRSERMTDRIFQGYDDRRNQPESGIVVLRCTSLA